MHNTTVAKVAGLAVGLALLASCGCSRDEPAPPSNINSTLPANTGASCVDDRGDISASSSQVGGNLNEPAGIDLVAAQAKLTADTLQVSFETAGPIEGTPTPEFILAQGPGGEVGSFELRAGPRVDGAGWDVELVTFQKLADGRVLETPPRTLTTPVTVVGNKLSYEVPQKDIPKPASYVWQFGARSGVDSTVFDDCDNAGGSGGTTTAPAPTGPTTTAAPNGSLRQSLTYPRGDVVTVYSVESPVQGGAAGATPPDPGFTQAAADVKVCAPATSSITIDTGNSFFVKGTDGNNYRVQTVAAPPHDPAFPASQVLAPNECKQAWVTFQLKDGVGVSGVIYAPGGDTERALLWTVA